jgi:hypothetical protein
MSRQSVDRRQFLTLSFLLFLGTSGEALGQAERREQGYDVDVSLLYSALTLAQAGKVYELVDRASGRYEIRAEGEGTRMGNRIVSQGVRRGGRWAPLHSTAWFKVVGRESNSELVYDYERRTVHYRFRGETFFLRRLRLADDTVAMPEGSHLDDVMSAVLNYSDRAWPLDNDGVYRTHVVRRRRPENEGPDDVQRFYRAEIVPFELGVRPDLATGKQSASFDLTRFSSWASESQPGRVVFGSDRRPETVTAPLILGTSVNIRFKGKI